MDEPPTPSGTRRGLVLLVTATVLLAPGVVAGLTAPISSLLGQRAVTHWWERLATYLWVAGFAAGLVAVVATPLGLLVASWGMVRSNDRQPWKRLTISLMILSVLGFLVFILVTIPPRHLGAQSGLRLRAVEQSVEADKPHMARWVRLAA